MERCRFLVFFWFSRLLVLVFWVFFLDSLVMVFFDCLWCFLLISVCRLRVFFFRCEIFLVSRLCWFLLRFCSRLLLVSFWCNSWFCMVNVVCLVSSLL